ncbi:MAG TPA: Ig-like domain-containing protein, partial [Solirubrobacteraceae bacterium]
AQWLATATPAISGTAGNATGDDAALTVNVYAGATATGVPVAVLSAVRTGAAWTVPVAPPLADGQYTAQARQGDASGNVTTTAARSFFVDTTTPVVSISAPTASQRVGARPPISGLAGILSGDGATVTVRIYAGASTGGTLRQTLTAPRNAVSGAWTVTPATLTDGTYTAQASQPDSAGHTGTSAPVTFVADGTPPAGVAITAPTANQTLPTATPTIAGTAGNATGDAASLTVNLYAGATATGAPTRVLTATRSGTAWSVPVGAALADGQYTVQAKQSDASGNTTTTTAVTFRTDTSAPTVTIGAPTAGQFVAGRPPISGTGGILAGDNALITVRIYAGSTTTGAVLQTLTTNRNAGTGAWTVTPALLVSGTYTVTATQTDAAGNTAVSAPITFTTDSVKPTALALSTANGAGGGQVAGRLDSGDSISFPYSEAMDPASILAGWSGAATPVNARFIDAGANDGLTLLNAGATATLGIAGGTTTTRGVRFGVDLVSANVTFTATMTLSADRKTVTVVLGTPDAPAGIRPGPVAAANSAWTINTAAQDLVGNAVTGGTVTEADNDRDF